MQKYAAGSKCLSFVCQGKQRQNSFFFFLFFFFFFFGSSIKSELGYIPAG
jgi:hypothetical protein